MAHTALKESLGETSRTRKAFVKFQPGVKVINSTLQTCYLPLDFVRMGNGAAERAIVTGKLEISSSTAKVQATCTRKKCKECPSSAEICY